jgi:hypothetical protein
MRLLLFSFLISTSLYAQVDTGDGSSGPCTRTTIANGGTFNCTTLDISGAPFAFATGAQAVVIKVQGNVSITTSVSLEGGIGGDDLFIGSVTDIPGGLAGPGATAGGGVLGSNGNSQNGLDHSPPTNAFGAAGVGGTCGGGGQGGAFAIPGDNGGDCASGGAGGQILQTVFTDVPSLLGGLGGGSGGDGFDGFYGAGGGGGGSLLITAGGNITINGSITAHGGKGGDSAPNPGKGGGGGGGGSGGAVVIKALGQITNNGAIDADGGIGGTSVDGANGGNGGHGFVILEDADGIIDGIGTIPPLYGETGTSISQRQKSSKVTSDISCGMIKPNEDSNSALMQIVLGFMLAIGFGFLSKKSLKLFA